MSERVTDEHERLIADLMHEGRMGILQCEREALRALLREREELRGAQVHLDAVEIALGLSRTGSRPASEYVVELRQKYLASQDALSEAQREIERMKAAQWWKSCTPAEREAASYYADIESVAQACDRRVRELEAQLADEQEQHRLGVLNAEAQLQAEREDSQLQRKQAGLLTDRLASEVKKRKRLEDKLGSHLIRIKFLGTLYKHRDIVERAQMAEALLTEADKGEGSELCDGSCGAAPARPHYHPDEGGEGKTDGR